MYINNNQLENVTLYPTAIKIVNTSALSLPFYTQLPTQHGHWMLNRHLKLNTSKTKFIPPQLLHSIPLSSAVFLSSVNDINVYELLCPKKRGIMSTIWNRVVKLQI